MGSFCSHGSIDSRDMSTPPADAATGTTPPRPIPKTLLSVGVRRGLGSCGENGRRYGTGDMGGGVNGRGDVAVAAAVVVSSSTQQ